MLIESRIVIATDTFARELGAKFGISGSRDNVYFSGSPDANAETRKSQVDTAQANAKAIREWQAGGSVGPAPIPSGPTIKRGLNWNLPVAAANNPARWRCRSSTQATCWTWSCRPCRKSREAR